MRVYRSKIINGCRWQIQFCSTLRFIGTKPPADGIGRIIFFAFNNLACKVLCKVAMSSYESIYKKMAASLEQGAGAGAANEAFDPDRHISPLIAHELNNILTIVQGYADRLLLRHSGDQALQPHLRVISEASKRAAVIVRDSTPPNANALFRQNQNSKQLESVALQPAV
jgi:signal transduction histidine kinase